MNLQEIFISLKLGFKIVFFAFYFFSLGGVLRDIVERLDVSERTRKDYMRFGVELLKYLSITYVIVQLMCWA